MKPDDVPARAALDARCAPGAVDRRRGHDRHHRGCPWPTTGRGAGHAEHAGAGRRRRRGHRPRHARAGDDDLAWAESILGAVGVVVRVTESLLDAVTGLSGSGPAYVFLVAEALIEAGVLERAAPRRERAARRPDAARVPPACWPSPATRRAVLRANVTSPGGTTAAGLRALEAAGVRAAFLDAVTPPPSAPASSADRATGRGRPRLPSPLRNTTSHFRNMQPGCNVPPGEEGPCTWPTASRAAVPDRRRGGDQQMRVSTMTVYRLIKADELASVRVGKSYRIRDDDLDRYLAKRYTEAG